MTKKLDESIKKPTLSPEAGAFIETYTGGEVPPELRAEMIRYVQAMQPVNEKSLAAMIADFDRILSQ
jgi:hypothetical protein